jgi:hypothetical protein
MTLTAIAHEWCFNHLIPPRSPHSGVNVSPRRALPHQGFICADRICASLSAAATSAWRQSENKPQSQLHVEWLTWTNTRRSIVVADGVGACAKSAEEVAARRCKVQAVEDIEHLHAELSIHSLRKYFRKHTEDRDQPGEGPPSPSFSTMR